MSDFNRLSDSQKSLLMIKLDGYIEAAVQAARLRNIGLLEALYAHLDSDPLRRASDRIGGIIARAMGEVSGSGGDIVSYAPGIRG
jgi:hypothetical protein